MAAERANLANYVSPVLAEQLARGMTGSLDHRNQDAAVMFVDVAGYTSLSEKLAPSETAAFLRDLHRLFERCASGHAGVITGFVGDGAMIVFGLPEPGPADAAASIACGRMLLCEAEKFVSPATGSQRIALRVSIHFGPVTTAILGGERQAQVTVTGDTVNVASRLQEIAKAQGTPFVFSRALYDAALRYDESSGVGFELSPGQPIRGRGGAIDVFLLKREGNTAGDRQRNP
jgi:adenylate cyclase